LGATFEEADAALGRSQYVFVQDGVTCHTSETSLAALREWRQLLPYWTGNSYDLNPIEMLWGMITRKLGWAEVKTVSEAVRVIPQAWNETPMAIINALCGSFRKRLRMMRDVAGASIQSFLSAHLCRIADNLKRPSNCLNPGAKGIWTTEEDRLLLDKYAGWGARWKKKKVMFPGRSPAALKKR
jgi:hypothetical protein